MNERINEHEHEREREHVHEQEQEQEAQPTELTLPPRSPDRRTIYIAGPDIFSPNGKAIGERYKTLCAKYGFDSIYPLDGSSVTATEDIDAAQVFRACIESIKSADIVVANLNNFRSDDNVDDGTAFELGVAFMAGIPIYGYRVDVRPIVVRHHGKIRDGYNWAYEDFGLPVNLMLGVACAKIVEGGFEDCLAAIYEHEKQLAEAIATTDDDTAEKIEDLPVPEPSPFNDIDQLSAAVDPCMREDIFK